MADPIQRLLHGLLRTLIRTVWSILSLVVVGGLAYFIGRQWGASQGEPNGAWYGLLGGFIIWSLFLRPRGGRRRRRLFGRGNSYTDFGGDSGLLGGDDGGGDD